MAYKKKISIVSTGREIYISSLRSSAGKIGSSSRWKDHVKKPTTHIRIYQDDYNKLVSLVGRFLGVDSITSAFSYVVGCVCSRPCMASKKS